MTNGCGTPGMKKMASPGTAFDTVYFVVLVLLKADRDS